MSISKELIDAIDRLVSSHGENDEGDIINPDLEEGWDSWWSRKESITFPVTLRGSEGDESEEVTMTLVSQFGGEGKGDDIWRVFQIGDQFFKKSGYYSSWNGTDWSYDFVEVTPVSVTVTEYKRKD
jgi:hypothetical protein